MKSIKEGWKMKKWLENIKEGFQIDKYLKNIKARWICLDIHNGNKAVGIEIKYE